MKNQFKKSLSLIMAVLMLMSCWVWVAPTEAEAADVNTQYYVIFKTNVKDTGDENDSKVTINFKYSNGTGSSSSVSKSYGKQGWSGDNVVIYEGYINGFPTSVSFNFDIDSTRSERHENYQLLVGKDKASCTTNVIPLDSYTYKGEYTYTKSVNADAYPVLSEGGATVSNESVTIGKVGTSTSASSKITLSGFKDQYGVAWGDLSYGFSLNAGDGVTIGSTASISKSSNTATVTVNPDFQKLFPGKSSAKLYVPWTASTKSGTVTIDVGFPTYTVTFDANGGKIGASDSDAQDKIEVTSTKMNYGSVIGKSPAYRAKDGFDFVGFYADKNADATGLTASFSGTKFSDDTTTIPAQGDVTYYAAWKAKPITATFMTADNQLIGTVEGRYNNYLTNSNMYNGLNGLNAAVKDSYDGTAVKFGADNAPIYKDGSSTYTFSHWKIIEGYDNAIVDKDHTAILKGDVTFQAVYKKADAKKYAVKFYDGNGNVINDASNKADYNFRDDVIMPETDPTKAQDDKYSYEFIGWANNIGEKFYAVDAENKDASGAIIVYTDKEAAEFTVRGDASYVPVFRMINREYKVTFKYTVDGGGAESKTVEGYHWDDVLSAELPEGIKDNYTKGGLRYPLTGWTDGTTTYASLDKVVIKGDVTLTAVYGAGVGADYTIRFFGKKDANLKDEVISEGLYSHGSSVTAPVVNDENGAIPYTIETATSLYTFAGWSPEFKAVAGADVDYYAQYSKKDYADLSFYNYDGKLIYSLDGNGKEDSLFVGDTIPAYQGETPVKAEDEVGTYTFTGWADADGNKVVPGTDKFTGDTELFAQFETEYKNYTVKFLNDDGSVISEKTYHYATEIGIPSNPVKVKDNAYEYEFRGWTPDISEVCYGDATYTATYRRSIRTYTVTWLNDKKEFYSKSNYRYDAKINQAVINDPSDPEMYPGAAEGYKYAFSHWVQCDAAGNDILVDGKQVIFTRGMKMPAEAIYFYPVFVETPNVLTVTFKDESNVEIGKVGIPYGESPVSYGDAFVDKTFKEPDGTYHYTVTGWVNATTGADVDKVTSDITLKPKYSAVEHSFNDYEVIKAPTCTETGLANIGCTDTNCNYVKKNQVIAIISDTVAPSGQIYVGDVSWKSNDTVDFEKITYIAPNTRLIISAADAGSRSIPWNVEGQLSRGVGSIEYYVSQEVLEDTTGITTWTEVYSYAAKTEEILSDVLKLKGITRAEYDDLAANDKNKLAVDAEVAAIQATYKANATGIASNLELENGKTYIIYVRVSDRKVDGASNSVIFSSGKISYGNVPAEIEVSGEGFGTKFCAEADIRITDDADGLKVYLDGEEVEAYTNPGTTAANGKFIATFKSAEKGLHTVTVEDKHGNISVKTFEIKGNHSYRNYSTAATCTSDGSRYDLCTICGNKANEVVIEKLGHSYTTNFSEKKATCLVDGYRTYICDHNCGTKNVIVYNEGVIDESLLEFVKIWVADESNPEGGAYRAATAADFAHLKSAGEHTYAKDDDGNDIWVVDKAPTCKTGDKGAGKQHKNCTVCGFRVEETIERDPDAHNFYAVKVTKEPTCTEKGKKEKTCRYCGLVEFVEYIDMLEHVEGEYRVITPATCTDAGSKILTCAECEADIGEAVEIPAFGHAYKATGDVYKEADKYYQNYVCGNDETHTKREEVEDYQPPVAAVVTFMNGENEFATVNSLVGNTISATQVAGTPEKAADATFRYTFAGWADAAGNEVKFPIDVEGNATYYATFTEKYINYTITYYREGGTEVFKKTGYLKNGEVVALADGPIKAEDDTYSYTFAGWKFKDSDELCGENVTINAANISLEPTYNSTQKMFSVTYAYSSSNIIHTYSDIPAGDPAPDVTLKFDVVKAADSKYHYTFKGWNKAGDLASVKTNVYTTPVFEGTEHTIVEEVIKTATCTENKVVKYTCTDPDCGYTYTKTIAGSTIPHLWGNPDVDEATGKTYVHCDYNCGASKESNESYIVKFFVNPEDTRALYSYPNIDWGKTIGTAPNEPTKASDSEYDYTFIGWKMKGDSTNKIYSSEEVAALEIKADISFVAEFEKKEIKYTVIFAAKAKDVIKTIRNIPVAQLTDDAAILALYGDDALPTKTPDEYGHYEFNGWSIDAPKDNTIYVTAKFTRISHNLENVIELNEATCTNAKGIRKWCDCNGNGVFDAMVKDEQGKEQYVDFFKDDTDGKLKEHDFKVVDHVDATPEKDGYTYYECEVCGKPKTEEHKYDDNTITVQVKVTHNGKAEPNIQVIVIEKSSSATPEYPTTNTNGIATVKVAKGADYDAYVVINGKQIKVTLTADAEGNLSATYNYNDTAVSCTCACHRDNFWGTIFRFFHKLIKLITGEFKCCGNPDPMYG